MSGKGSNRRPTQISEEEAEANWQRIFGKKDKQDGKKTTNKEQNKTTNEKG